MAGPVAVVRRMADGSHGVRVICTRRNVDFVTLTPAEWRAIWPKIEAACALAERPGELPQPNADFSSAASPQPTPCPSLGKGGEKA